MLLCLPITAYAANQGILKFQNIAMIQHIETDEEEKWELPSLPEIITQNYPLETTLDTETVISLRGSNPIYVSVPTETSYAMSTVKLSKGDTISFALVSSTGGKFSVSIVDENGTAKTFTSSEGGVIKNLSISKDGKYRIVLKNKDSEDMIISGNITIK